MLAGEPRRKFEFALLAILIGALVLVLLAVLDAVRNDMEEAAVREEVAAMRVELLDVLAHREAQGGALPESRNPVQWTGRAPESYLGELDSTPAAVGVWYFNRPEGVLAYRYRGGGEVRFRLAVGQENRKAPAVLGGVGLVRLKNEKSS